jgi:cation transport regulator ChaC
MAQIYGSDNLAIFAYGSLLSDPGEKIAARIIARVPYPSPWPIEYARRATMRGHGPTLVIHETGGIVQGQLLVLDLEAKALEELREWLWEREGRPPRERLKAMECGRFGCVLYCDLESTLRDEEINPDSLAAFAIASVRQSPARNAIRYLAQNIEQGIITPLTCTYHDAILRLTGTIDLREAEMIAARCDPAE